MPLRPTGSTKANISNETFSSGRLRLQFCSYPSFEGEYLDRYFFRQELTGDGFRSIDGDVLFPTHRHQALYSSQPVSLSRRLGKVFGSTEVPNIQGKYDSPNPQAHSPIRGSNLRLSRQIRNPIDVLDADASCCSTVLRHSKSQAEAMLFPSLERDCKRGRL